jgi:hypothetical protein
MDAGGAENEECPSGGRGDGTMKALVAYGGKSGGAREIGTRAGSALLTLSLAFSIAACAPGGVGSAPESPPSSTTPARPLASAQFVPGLYNQPDGSVQALGTLEYRDLEGGTWVIVGGSAQTGDAGKTVVVIANAAEFTAKLESLKGVQVVATGQRLDGASIRMAGPEMAVTAIDGATQSSSEAQ